MGSESEFNRDIKKFIQMLKKVLQNQTLQEKLRDHHETQGSSELNFNFFIFPLIPMSADEMDEFEEIYENFMFDEAKVSEELSPDLTEGDREFLRRHGIRF